MIIRISNCKEDHDKLQSFLDSAGASLVKFRYFKSRGFDVLDNHLLTILYMDDRDAVGYGHIDKDNETIWLGICVAETHTGRGIGKSIMQYLNDFQDEMQIDELMLMVDWDNKRAIELYNKFEFQVVKEKEDHHYLMIRKRKIL